MNEPSDPSPGGPSGTRLALLTVAVVAVLVAPLGVAAVHAARGGFDSGTPPASAASRRTASADPSPTPSTTPSPTPSPTPSDTSPTPSRSPRPAVRCWDGSSARRESACSEPRGARGLAWVFPSLAGQRCGRATDAGPSGLVLRRVCHARVGGDRAVVVYAQWSSPAAAVSYVEGQGLSRAGGSAGLERFRGETRRGTQVAQVYADEPFAFLVTLPPGVDPAAVTGDVASARPPGQVRGRTG